jgi:hypothetical protein
MEGIDLEIHQGRVSRARQRVEQRALGRGNHLVTVAARLHFGAALPDRRYLDTTSTPLANGWRTIVEDQTSGPQHTGIREMLPHSRTMGRSGGAQK